MGQILLQRVRITMFEKSNLLINFFFTAQLQEIENFTAAKLVCSVTDVAAVTQNAFLTSSTTNPMVNCASIPKFNFALFRK